jgi:hypothetical protein
MSKSAIVGAVSAAALVGACVPDGNDFMTRAHHANEVRWVADIVNDGGADCPGRAFDRATIRIKGDVMTIWPYTGYMSEEYALSLKTLNPDGSGRIETAFGEDEDAAGKTMSHKMTFHLDPGVGPRRMIQHTNYIDRCSWTWTPEDVKPTGAIKADDPKAKPTTPPDTTPTVFSETPNTSR